MDPYDALGPSVWGFLKPWAYTIENGRMSYETWKVQPGKWMRTRGTSDSREQFIELTEQNPGKRNGPFTVHPLTLRSIVLGFNNYQFASGI